MTQRTRVDCDRCGKPDSAMEALFCYRSNVHEPGAMWNYRVCPPCARTLKRGRRVISKPAPLISAPGTPSTDHLCWGVRGWDRWHDQQEHETALDDEMFDRMAMDRG